MSMVFIRKQHDYKHCLSPDVQIDHDVSQKVLVIFSNTMEMFPKYTMINPIHQVQSSSILVSINVLSK